MRTAVRIDVLLTECRTDIRHTQSVLTLPETTGIDAGGQRRHDAVLLKTTGASDTTIIAYVDQTRILPLDAVLMKTTGLWFSSGRHPVGGYGSGRHTR